MVRWSAFVLGLLVSSLYSLFSRSFTEDTIYFTVNEVRHAV